MVGCRRRARESHARTRLRLAPSIVALAVLVSLGITTTAGAQTEPSEVSTATSQVSPPVAEGLYRLRVADSAPFRDELPTEVWLTHLASRERRPIQRDTPSWLLDPPLVGDGPTSRRVEWCMDTDGRLLLDWTTSFHGVRVALTLASDGTWIGTVWKHYDFAIPGQEKLRWPAQLAPIELGPRDTAWLFASRFGGLERVLPAEGAVGGPILRRCTGEVLKETVDVWVLDADGRELARTHCRGGSFLLEGITPGKAPHQLVVHWTVPGILPMRDRWLADHEVRAVVELGDLPPWPRAFAVEVDTGWRIVVEVVDANGVAVPAEVRAAGANGHASAVRITSRDDRTVHEWANFPWDAEPILVRVNVDDVTVHEEIVEPPDRSEPTRRLRVVVGD